MSQEAIELMIGILIQFTTFLFTIYAEGTPSEQFFPTSIPKLSITFFLSGYKIGFNFCKV